MLDLPQMTEDQPAHRPLIAAHASPWPGEMAVFRSASTDGFELLTPSAVGPGSARWPSTSFRGRRRASIWATRWSSICCPARSKASRTCAVRRGECARGRERRRSLGDRAGGHGRTDRAGRYQLTRLLRGQRGTEGAMGNPAPAGARVVVLDTALASLPIAEADLGLPWNWRIGPAAVPVSDASYAALGFTPTGRGCGPSRRPMSSSRGARRAARRSDDPLDTPVPRAGRRCLGQARGAARRGPGKLRGPDPRRHHREAGADQITTSVLYTAAQQTADWGAPLAPATRSTSASTSSPPSSGGARPRPSRSRSEGHPMSDATTHLLLPYILAAQAQKHVTHNEALRLLDAMVQLSVLDRTRTAPPASPRRWQPLHLVARARPASGRVGSEHRLLDRRRMDPARAAHRLAGLGRGRGAVPRLDRQRHGRWWASRATSRTRSSAS
jgi:hypothetical protein